VVQSMARQRKMTLGKAASELILRAVAKPGKLKQRNGVPLVGDGIPMTMAEVQAGLDED
jgi:hypothetical protein